ncbi:MAG: D-alanine--D-alanine ligase family protein [Gemmatimonadaceae bacterium]
MKIALLFDGVSALGASPDLLILETVEAVERVLSSDGEQVVRIPVDPDGRWIERIRRGRFDLAFNLCEGIDGVAAFEPAVIGVLELLGVPCTGSSSYTTSLCLRKHIVNGVLGMNGLPVPRFGVARRAESEAAPPAAERSARRDSPRASRPKRLRIPAVGFPAICKPASEDASIGIEQRSVVRTVRALTERIAAMHERWDEVLVQRYVEGREVNVGILGSTVLPLAEIDFGELPKGMWRIVTYRSKWDTGSDEDRGTQPQCPAELPAELVAEIGRLALAAWRAVGGEGYGRVDFRIDRSGRPWLLEVNSNPDLAPDAGLARMARVTGLGYDGLVRELCALALDSARGSEMTGGSDPAGSNHWTVAQRLSGIRAPVSADAPEIFAIGHR